MKIHIEADSEPFAYREAVVYITLDELVEGVELHLRLKEGVAVTDCWPRWPDRMGEREAVWFATLYPRRFEGGILYSFGVRLGLKGGAQTTIDALKWRAEGRAVVLEAIRGLGLRAVIGPLLPGFKILGSHGEVGIVGERGAQYVVVEGEAVSLRLELEEQGIVGGFVEYEPEPTEMPFEVEVRGIANPIFERKMVVRLQDLLPA